MKSLKRLFNEKFAKFIKAQRDWPNGDEPLTDRYEVRKVKDIEKRGR